MRTFNTLLAAGLLAGLALTTTVPAMAEPSPDAVVAAPTDQLLSADKSEVRAGNTLTLRLDHGDEGVNWISSKAFVRNREHPFGADEGLAEIVRDRGGRAEAVATIADVPPGEYTVHTRVGGGAGPTLRINVIK
ncbi:hypothetical protein [Saccharopolyspora phatthalungensis]|uniref:Proteinase inhibitor I42 chagasin domain-containing protein n=1 Tax=Saccharopolyspora phatthalungensis TaxID=664693 RepID=A0A840Q782_9PSEU|nr:hypothetical protein [Saccharopolyspora phatthalungensis]MBB5154509.1 hypothetical protein [Saccharopolyspora phatthalungensis]